MSNNKQPLADLSQIKDLDALREHFEEQDIPDEMKRLCFLAIDQEAERRSLSERDDKITSQLKASMLGVVKEFALANVKVICEIDAKGEFKEIKWTQRYYTNEEDRPVLFIDTPDGRHFESKSMRSLAFAIDPKLRKTINARTYLADNGHRVMQRNPDGSVEEFEL